MNLERRKLRAVCINYSNDGDSVGEHGRCLYVCVRV